MDDKFTTKRRWYQFSLRTMFVGITLASVPLAWVGHSLNWIRQRHSLLEQNRATLSVVIGPDEVPTAPGSLWLFGEVPVYIIFCSKDLMAEAARLFPESKVIDRDTVQHF